MELRTQQAAELLGVSRREFYTLVNEGKIKPTSYTKGGHMRFSEQSLLQATEEYPLELDYTAATLGKIYKDKEAVLELHRKEDQRMNEMMNNMLTYIEPNSVEPIKLLPLYKRLYKKILRSIGIIK